MGALPNPTTSRWGALRTWDLTVTACCSSRQRRAATVDDMAIADARKTDSRLAARCAAIASLGAAVIHFAVTPMHGREWLPSGVFFAALAAFQLLWAIAAWFRPGALVLASGIAVNLGAAGLWVYSCVSGPPVGPALGQPEAVGAAGICVLLLQCYVVMGAAFSWSHKSQPDQVSGWGRAFVLLGANAVIAVAVTAGLVSSLQGHHHHHSAVTEADGHPDAIHDELGQPVTDMSLHAPAATPVKPAPADSVVEADGHSHHHDD